MSAHADEPEVLPDGRVLLRLPDPAHRHHRARLLAGLGTLDPRPDLSWSDGVWSVRAALPPVDRVEYAFEVTTAGQPAPAVVPGGVLERPGYAPPAWCGREVPDGAVAPLPLDVAGVTARLWSPAGLDGPAAAPLLVVHDGPDYLEHAALGRYLSVLAADGEAPPTRVLALTADPRDRLYGACDEYAQALVAAVLPRANEHAPTTAVVGLGASLGALAVLHAEWRHPGTFGAMLLQSGAFFTPATDPQERGFPAWDAVTGLVAEVGEDDRAADLPPTVVTCGAHEENAANNRLLARRLAEVGVATTHAETGGLHTMRAWRDALHPGLRDLLVAVA